MTASEGTPNESDDLGELDDADSSALVSRTLTWADSANHAFWPKERLVDLLAEAALWQGVTKSADLGLMFASTAAVSKSHADYRAMDLEHINRLKEIVSLIGGVGEQSSLAWSAFQDAQRVAETAGTRGVVHQRIILRANAEMVTHFILGSGHSLANLVLRILLLNPSAAARLNKKFPKAESFPAFSDELDSWRTFNESLAGTLRNCALETGNAPMGELGTAIVQLWHSSFKDLDRRRGLDYHRRRPQSVSNTAFDPVITEDGTYLIPILSSASLDPRSDAEEIYGQVADTMSALATAMVAIGAHLGDAIRAERFFFDIDRDWVSLRPEAAGDWARQS